MVVNEAGKTVRAIFTAWEKQGLPCFSYLRFASRFFFLLLKLIGNVFRFAQKPAFDGFTAFNKRFSPVFRSWPAPG